MQAEHPTGGHQNVPPCTASAGLTLTDAQDDSTASSQGFHQFWQQKRILFVFKNQLHCCLALPEVAVSASLGKATPVWGFQL